MIVLEPLGGLGNRMRAMDAAMTLSKKIDKPLHVVWRRNSALNCNFDELFLMPKSIAKLIQVNAKTPARELPAAYDNHIDRKRVEHLLRQGYDFEALRADRTVFISTWNRFYGANDLFRDLIPVAPLQNIIDAHAKNFTNTVGVHIRRTDNVKSIQHSPTARFIELMQKEIDHNASVKFFLATDSPEEEERMKNLFTDRIITHRKRSLNRKNRLAIQDALIDLFCLSKCQKLIGSYWSSFTDTAAEIGGIEKVIVGGPEGDQRLGFDDLEVGQGVKVKGMPDEDGVLAAQEISVEAPADRAEIEGIVQNIDNPPNVLRLLNREFTLPEGIVVKDLQRHPTVLKNLQAGDRVKLSGTYLAPEGFVPQKIKIQSATDSGLAELRGEISKIDRKTKTLEVIGFTVAVNEKAKIF
jgi:hypothetical protein